MGLGRRGSILLSIRRLRLHRKAVWKRSFVYIRMTDHSLVLYIHGFVKGAYHDKGRARRLGTVLCFIAALT
jgi:hypothetical protein